MTVITVIIAGIFASVSTSESFGISMRPPPLAIVEHVGSDGEIVETNVADWENPQVACWVWQKLFTTNTSGEIVDQVESNVLKTNPTVELALFDKGSGGLLTEGNGKGGFVSLGGIKCASSTGEQLDPEKQFGFFDGSDVAIPLTVERTELVLRMYTEDMDCDSDLFEPQTCGSTKLFHDMYNSKIVTNEINIDDTEKKELWRKEIKASDIEKFLENGDYHVEFKLAVDGLIKLQYDCGAEACSHQSYVIPVGTTRNEITELNHEHWGANNWRDIRNPVLVTTELHVVKNIADNCTGTSCIPETPSPPEELECAETEYWSGTRCVEVTGGDLPPENDGCPANTIRVGTSIPPVCVSTTGGNVPPVVAPPNSGSDPFSQLNVCLASGDPSCLFSSNFLAFWLGGFGFILLIGAVAQGASKPRQPDIYGVPAY